ncbi:MAG: TlpA disulfide reductase family protein, partial [Myxococcota bacterium]
VVAFAGWALARDARPRPAPELALPVGAGLGVGDRVRLGDLRGEVVVLDFWASWCRPCYRGVPVLNDLGAAAGVRVYGVNVERLAPRDLGAAHAALGARFPSLDDREGLFQAAFEVTSLPTLVVLDAAGEVALRHVGVMEAETLRRALAELGVNAGP